MKDLIILGAGTGGTMVANHLEGKLPQDWTITVVDPSPTHLYQPSLLFIPFGKQGKKGNLKPRATTLGGDIRWRQESVENLDRARHEVVLGNGEKLHWDLLVVATGSDIYPEETEGMAGEPWQNGVYDFYTLEGALNLQRALRDFEGGRLVLNTVEMPIKCPVAPLEFLFLADEFFHKRGLRDLVELVYVTPLDGAFTKPVCNRELNYLLESKGITLETDFNVGSVDNDRRVIQSWDEREISYDLLVSIPTHMGAEFIGKAGLGDDLRFVPTDRHTLLARDEDSIFVLGDATNLPSSKAGSVAHFQSEVVAENIVRAVENKSPVEGFDGHANCFIESGFGKALLIDFNYETEPLPGTYPIPGIGPFSLLKETRINHLGKLGFRWAYWNMMLPARPLPVSNHMSMAGKRLVNPEMVSKGEAI